MLSDQKEVSHGRRPPWSRTSWSGAHNSERIMGKTSSGVGGQQGEARYVVTSEVTSHIERSTLRPEVSKTSGREGDFGDLSRIWTPIN